MEARLLCLEQTGPLGAHHHKTWLIANGTGVAITQAQIPTPPPPLYTIDSGRRELIDYLTAKMAEYPFTIDAESGWSDWFVGKHAER